MSASSFPSVSVSGFQPGHEQVVTATATTATTAATAVDRALAVLCAFTRETPTLGVTELSERLGLTKSTVHRVLHELMARGLVTQEPLHRRYALGYRVLALAQAVPSGTTLRQLCRPYMQHLRDETQETIGLYVLAGDVRMCLEEFESPQALRMAAGIGRCFPLDRGAASKVLLLSLPPEAEARRRVTEGRPQEERESLARELDEIRRAGFAGSTNETVVGAASVAVPIYESKRTEEQVVAALSVAGPTARFDAAAIARHARAAMECADQIRRMLATRPPDV